MRPTAPLVTLLAGALLTGACAASEPDAGPGVLWTHLGPTSVTDAVDVAQLRDSTVLWLTEDGVVRTATADGSVDLRATDVAGLPGGIVDVSGRPVRDEEFTAAAVDGDGGVWMWGRVVTADPATGAVVDEVVPAPVRIAGVEDAVSVTVGIYATYAVTERGTVVSWGRASDYRFLGRDTDAEEPQPPAELSGPAGIVDVTSGYYATFALASDGTVWGWGSNNFGLLAADDEPGPDLPTRLPLTDIAAIDAFAGNAAALTRAGTVLTWGEEAGDAVPDAPVTRPLTLPVPAGATTVVTGDGGGFAFGPEPVAWGEFRVPDGRGGLVDNPTGGPLPVDWITGTPFAGEGAGGLDYRTVFLVRE